jgi:hypothetical protein
MVTRKRKITWCGNLHHVCQRIQELDHGKTGGMWFTTRALRREVWSGCPAGMRFLPNLVRLHGFTLAEVPVNHRPRLKGGHTISNRLWVD